MSTFIEMTTRIAAELRRSNLTNEIKRAINDAITEAAEYRFYFNEMHTGFSTVIDQEYYPDLGLVELDAAWYIVGTTKYGVDVVDQLAMNDLNVGNVSGGAPQSISRYGGQLRLYPIPSAIYAMFVDGYGKLSPAPLVDDTDSNAWLEEGELYIRALAKRNVLRDVVRDYGEARVLEGVAEDYKSILENSTTLRSSDDRIRSTQF